MLDVYTGIYLKINKLIQNEICLWMKYQQVPLLLAMSYKLKKGRYWDMDK